METGKTANQTPGLTAQEIQFFENRLLSYSDAAKYLGVSESYLRRLKAKGQVPFVCVGNRAVRFRVSSLTRWIEKREVPC
jgi:excisionase family DNA binding protein